MPTLLEFDWLGSSEAQSRLADLAADDGSTDKPSPRTVAQLRKHYSAEQTHLLLKQAELRVRARKKFSRADQMLFTPLGLEQATDEQTALYKASRFRQGESVADFCCGIGGDLLALANRVAKVRAVDRDPFTLACAQHNAALYGLANLETVAADVGVDQLQGCDAWHIDPDRRSAGRRTTLLEGCSPSVEMLDTLIEVCPNASIKLAPATEVPAAWETDRELEWISRRGECRQLIAWAGELATASGKRKATVLSDDLTAHTFTGKAFTAVETAPEIGDYLFDPNPAVLAAELCGSLAIERGLRPIAPGAVYLTGSEAISDPLLRAYTVLDILPLDRKPLANYFAERAVGTLEIKSRGIELDLGAFRKSLRLKGDHDATLIATRRGKKKLAIIARRCPAR